VETLIHVGLSGCVVAIVGWLLTVEPRLRVQTTEYSALKELILSKLDDTNRRLERIEKALNGYIRD